MIDNLPVTRKIRIVEKYRWYNIILRFIKNGIWKTRKVITFDSILKPPELVHGDGVSTFSMNIKPIDGVRCSEE
jgi:hypothetical protein